MLNYIFNNRVFINYILKSLFFQIPGFETAKPNEH
jgi:hypothetical protein